MPRYIGPPIYIPSIPVRIVFNVLRFHWEQERLQFHYVPTKDISAFYYDYPNLYFEFIGCLNPPFVISYLDIFWYQGHQNIPTWEVVVSDIEAALLHAAEIAAGVSLFQKFIATAGQTEFVVTDFVPTQYALVLVDDIPNMSNWTLSGNTVTFNVGLPLGSVVIIYQ
jgi:hypothetical protein